jgi:hypothetical protein
VSEITLVIMLATVPRLPQIVTGTRSKLKICETKIVKKNCLIREDSGFTLKWIAVSMIATISGMTLIMAKSMF